MDAGRVVLVAGTLCALVALAHGQVSQVAFSTFDNAAEGWRPVDCGVAAHPDALVTSSNMRLSCSRARAGRRSRAST